MDINEDEWGQWHKEISKHKKSAQQVYLLSNATKLAAHQFILQTYHTAKPNTVQRLVKFLKGEN
ncbi:hypothetical protein KOM07_05185 [Lentilactobacillus sp. G22-6]|uniref:hypothetical protein n=1 Tax=Lentilactobacillus dabitei TaxID=2831523 RepID=UPI001C266FD5|nr:hypothetical protein [Lentilactobacillus dabitei]MBU9788932.1 hypothetical protein [Lentilactobacillus dabitei]